MFRLRNLPVPSTVAAGLALFLVCLGVALHLETHGKWILGGLGITAFVFLSFVRLEWLIYASVLAVPLTPAVNLLGLPINADDVLPFYILGLAFIKAATTKRLGWHRTPVDLVIFGLVGLAVLTLGVQAARENFGFFPLAWEVLGFVKHLDLLLYYFFALIVFKPPIRQPVVLNLMLATAVIVALLGFLLGADQQGRITSTFARPTSLAAYLGFNTILCLGLVPAAGPRRRLLLLAAAAVLVAATLYTGTRMTVVSLPLAVMALFWLNRQWPLALAVPLLALAVWFAGLVPGTLRERLNDAIARPDRILLGEEVETPGSVNLPGIGQVSNPRLLTWRGRLEMIYERPLFGYGFRLHRPTAHNSLLEAAVRSGLPGAIMVGWLILGLLATLLARSRQLVDQRHRALARAVLAGFLLLLVNSVFSDAFSFPRLMFQFWALFALVEMVRRRELADRERHRLDHYRQEAARPRVAVYEVRPEPLPPGAEWP